MYLEKHYEVLLIRLITTTTLPTYRPLRVNNKIKVNKVTCFFTNHSTHVQVYQFNL